MSRSIVTLLQEETQVELDRLEMFESLLKAVEKAGGSRSVCFDKIIKRDMKVSELIDTLAQNKIRFIYVGGNK